MTLAVICTCQGLRGTSLDVDDVFVPLALDLGGRGESFSSSEFLRAGKRLLVVGDPGSGKSTLLKQVFREACRETHSAPTREPLPIRLELKRFSPPANLSDDRHAGEWLLGQIKDAVVQVEGFEIAELFDDWVADAGLLVLLDGLDEVASDKYYLMAASLRGLSRILAGLSGKNQIVVSMRIQFHQQIRADLLGDYPQSLYVRPFTPNEIYTFLNRWPFKERRDIYIKRIYGTLTDRPTLREMCSNPLVLAMYVENHYESSSTDILWTRTQFYEEVVNELLFKRRQRQEVTTSAGRFVSLRDQREAILGELALQNLIDPAQASNSLSWGTALNIAMKTWKCDQPEAELRLKELANETGLIADERTSETVRFIHLTFCEFLAAVQCARGHQNGWATLISAHRKFQASGVPALQSRLVEVLPFTLALLPRVGRPAALADVATLDDRLVLGRCFLETQLYNEPEWATYLTNEREFLTDKGKYGWDDSLLRRLQLFSVVVRDARDWHEQVARKTADQLEDVFSVIVGGSRHTLIQVFVTYASQDAAAAIRLADDVGVDIAVEYPELVIKSSQEAAFLALAIDKAARDDGEVWKKILIESALVHSNVANELAQRPAETFKGLRVADKKISRILHYVPESRLYHVLLSHVLAGSDDMSVLHALRGVIQNSTRFYWVSKMRVSLRIGTLIGTLACLTYIALYFSGSLHSYNVIPIAAAITLAVLFASILATISAVNYDFSTYIPKGMFNLGFGLYSTQVLETSTLIVFNVFFPAQLNALRELDAIRVKDLYPRFRADVDGGRADA